MYGITCIPFSVHVILLHVILYSVQYTIHIEHSTIYIELDIWYICYINDIV